MNHERVTHFPLVSTHLPFHFITIIYLSQFIMTMLSSPHQQHSYRAALSLNNAGASLLERGLYREAYKTLTESLLLVKQVFQGEQQEHKSLHQEQPVMDEPQSLTDSFLRSAAVRLAGPFKEERTSSVVVDVTIVEDADWCALRRAAVYGPSTSVVFAVRISEENFESITQHFGVLLYNHGLAAFLLNRQILLEQEDKNSKASSSSKKARSYLAKAQASWQMADRTLDSVLQTTNDEDDDDTSAAGDTSNQVQIILLSALVLHALSVVYRQQKNLIQAHEAQALGHALCQDLEDDGYCQQMLLISSSTHTAAAA